MANSLYNITRQDFLTATTAWTAYSPKVILLKSGYTFDEAHQFLDEVASAARVGTPQEILTLTANDGKANGSGVTFSSLAVGETVEAILIYHDTGVEATSQLIAYIDDARGLPFVTTDGDLIVQWDVIANAIFRL